MQSEQIEVTLASGQIARVTCAGEGQPVVFLHGRLGCRWDAYLDGLAQNYRVYAPLHPGVADEDELAAFDSISDLVMYYDDLFAALQLETPTLIGHSFGGMVAAEYAAWFSDKIARLVLIDSLGLWRDDEPVADIDATPTADVPGVMFSDPGNDNAAPYIALPEDPMEQAGVMLERVAVIAATNHFIWPIPDRNLRRRLYRISVPALVLWGSADGYVPVSYAGELAEGLSDATLQVLDGAGHFAQLEQIEQALAETAGFIS